MPDHTLRVRVPRNAGPRVRDSLDESWVRHPAGRRGFTARGSYALTKSALGSVASSDFACT